MIGECNIGLNMFIMNKLLKKIVKEAMRKSLQLRRNVLQAKKEEFKIMDMNIKDFMQN